MFALRDEMFDYAAAGNISFSDPAYRLLRQSMNGFIRYGHRLSFFSLCMTIFQWKKLGVVPDKSWNTQWESAIGKVREESARKALLDYHARTELLVAERVVFSSPLLLAVIFSVWCGALLHMSWRGLRNATNKAATVMMAKIVDPSLLDEEAARLAVA